jgi:hypothetical protein
MSESKMVPREPTYGMTQAACAVAERIVNSGPMRPMADAIAAMYWRAMVDAAPTINEPVPPSSDDLVKELRFTHCQNDGLHDQAADAIASLTAERDALRADAERVPREPTVVMVNTGVNVMRVTGGNIYDDVRAMWRVMYDAAPPAAIDKARGG